MLTLDTTQCLAENTQRLTQMGYSEVQIQVCALYQVMCDAKHSQEVGEEICKRINFLLGKQLLTFARWDGDKLFATDNKGYNYVVPGSWWDCRYVVRGLIRQYRRHGGWSWLCNGQAAKGSINIGNFGEHVQLRFPEFVEISEEWTKFLNGGIK